jgi:hypothetical protein
MVKGQQRLKSFHYARAKLLSVLATAISVPAIDARSTANRKMRYRLVNW